MAKFPKPDDTRDIAAGEILALALAAKAGIRVVEHHSEDLAEPSIAGALDVAGRFGLKAAAAKAILREVFTSVSAWRLTGRRLRLNPATLDAYASAFEHEQMDEARRLLE